MRIRAALLDMDGTLFDSRIDWLALRKKLELPWDGRPILAQLQDAPPDVRTKGLGLLHEAERVGAKDGELIPGTHEILESLRRHSIRCALITNNSRRSVETVLRRYRLSFDLVLTRDDGPTKPDPESFVRALAQLQVDPSDAVAIGDAHLDLIAAHRAGISEIILVGTPAWMKEHIPSDVEHHEAANLIEAREILERLLAVRRQS
jgi:HAD superfamily hydrolase (TIGR01509 family)